MNTVQPMNLQLRINQNFPVPENSTVYPESDKKKNHVRQALSDAFIFPGFSKEDDRQDDFFSRLSTDFRMNNTES